jgi:hypothetical protein
MLDSAGNYARARVDGALRPAPARIRFRNSKFDGTNPPMVVRHLRTAIGSVIRPSWRRLRFCRAPSAWAHDTRMPCRRTVRFSGIRGATDNRAAKRSSTLTLPQRTWEGIRRNFAATARNDQNVNPFSLYNSAANVVSFVRRNRAEIHGSVPDINPSRKPRFADFVSFTFHRVQGHPCRPPRR